MVPRGARRMFGRSLRRGRIVKARNYEGLVTEDEIGMWARSYKAGTLRASPLFSRQRLLDRR